MGFVGCNVNPDPSGGFWTGPPLWDRSWWPLWEAMCELDVPAMIHVSASCNENLFTTGSHYLGADTTAFMQALSSGFMRDFPGLRWIIPHGGGAVPYHWGRFKGMAADHGWDFDGLADHIFYDTCVYHQRGIDLLVDVVPVDNILFGSEMVGAVRGVDPDTGNYYDDTKIYIDHSRSTPRPRSRCSTATSGVCSRDSCWRRPGDERRPPGTPTPGTGTSSCARSSAPPPTPSTRSPRSVPPRCTRRSVAVGSSASTSGRSSSTCGWPGVR